MFKVILVPIDRSSHSEVALARAVSLARSFDSHLILLNVIDIAGWTTSTAVVNPLDWQIQKTDAMQYLQERAGQLQALGLDAGWQMLQGDATAQIVDFIKEHAVDLTVLGATGQNTDQEWNIGSVAYKLIQRARVSLLLVRGAALPDDQGEQRYRRILLPMDGSQRAECVLPVAAILARRQGGQYMLAHVVRRPEMPRRTPPTPDEVRLADALVDANQKEAERYLAWIKERLPGEVETRILVGNNPASTLHQLALQEQIDLIVLSAHGYSYQPEWPYGSLTASFVMQGVTSVLVVQDGD
ncbi:MAG: universal stress protein [Chloroflexi bacterium]|nr:universal stress protein [Chloroflexota bacterium]MCL5275033.1 universal stress protein [Chloroflexota bacterium]